MRVSVDVFLDVPPAEAWADISRLATHAEWMVDADTIDIVSETDRGVGTVMRVPTTIGPLTTEDWIIVTEWVEGFRIGVIHIGAVTGTGAFELVPEAGGTRFMWTETLTLPGWLGFAEPMVAPIIRAVWVRNLRRLESRLGG